MKSQITLILASAMLTLGASAIKAQTSIGDLQQNSGLTIAGTISNVVGNEFILEDGTGEIIVDAGPRWYHQINLTQGEQVTVVGEYDDDDFDAYSITRSNGEEILIRDGFGPPPWAGSR